VTLTLLVCVSLVGLAVGPLIATLSRGRQVPGAVVDGLAVGVVPAVLLLRIFPHLWKSLGAAAGLLGSVGYVALWLADRRGHASADRVAPAVIFPALAVHSLTDGALLGALSMSPHLGALDGAMCAALVIHRLPEGLFLATAAPGAAPSRTWRRIAGLMGATVLGAIAGGALLRLLPEALFDGVAAVGFGAILRLATHSHAAPATSRAARAAAGLAFVAGIALVAAIRMPDDILMSAQPSEPSLLEATFALFVETSPAMLAGLVAALLCRTWLWQPRLVAATVAGGLLSLQFLGDRLTLVRAAASLPVALIALIPWRRADQAPRADAAYSEIIQSATSPYVVGVLVAAALEALLPADIDVQPVGAYVVVLGLTIAAALRPLGATPAAAVLLHRDIPTRAIAVLLVLAVLGQRPPGRMLRAATILLTAALAAAAALVADRVVGETSIPGLHALFRHRHGPVEYGCMVVLIALILASLIGRGPRTMLQTAPPTIG
jgi:hypothetical protein